MDFITSIGGRKSFTTINAEEKARVQEGLCEILKTIRESESIPLLHLNRVDINEEINILTVLSSPWRYGIIRNEEKKIKKILSCSHYRFKKGPQLKPISRSRSSIPPDIIQ